MRRAAFAPAACALEAIEDVGRDRSADNRMPFSVRKYLRDLHNVSASAFSPSLTIPARQ